MTRNTRFTLAFAAALAGVACSEPTNSASEALLLQESFATLPVSFGLTTSSFAGDTTNGLQPFEPHGHGHGGPGGPGGPGGFGGFGGEFGGGPGRGGHGPKGGLFGGLMGGGLFEDFYGGRGSYGPGYGHRPFDSTAVATCAFDAATSRVACTPVTNRGITSTRSYKFTNAAGVVQQSRDSLTNTINTQTTVAGTLVRRDSSTSVVAHASDRTVSGLAKGTTQVTLVGTTSGKETTTGVSDAGNFTSVRISGDTATGIVIPVENGRPTYPTAGTVVRSMSITMTVVGSAPASSARREVVTYDGSATAKVVITQDGTTKNCTLPLPRGRMVCQ
jgi:hypothetical protein